MPRYTTFMAALSLVVLGQFSNARTAEAGVKLQMRDGLPVVDGVYLNGSGPYRFLLDTGAAINQMEPALANALGLQPTFKSQLGSSTTGWAFVTGAGGITVAVDGAQADEQKFFFAGLETLQLESSNVQGVLGQEFLSRFDYLLDLKAKRLEFGSLVPTPQKGTRVDFTMVDGRPALDTSLGRLILDSAADVLVRFNISGGVSTRQIATLTGTTSVSMVRSALLINGRAIWKGHAAAVPMRAGSGADGLLPVTLFKTVYVSNSEGYLVLD